MPRVLRLGSGSFFSWLAAIGVGAEDADDKSGAADLDVVAMLAIWTLMSDSDNNTWASAISTCGKMVERGTRGFLAAGGGFGLGSALRLRGFLAFNSVGSVTGTSSTVGLFSSVTLAASGKGSVIGFSSATVFSSAKHGEAVTVFFFLGPRLPAGVLRLASALGLFDLRGFLPVVGLTSGFWSKLRG